MDLVQNHQIGRNGVFVIQLGLVGVAWNGIYKDVRIEASEGNYIA